MAVALCFCLRQARLRCWLLASHRAKARLLFPLFLRTKMEMNRSSGYDAAKMLCLESTPLGDSPPLCLAVHGLGRGQRDAQGAQSVMLLPAGGQGHTSFRDLQPHGFRYLNHPKEQTHKTNGVSSGHGSGRVGRREQHCRASGHDDRSPKAATRGEAGETPARASATSF